MYIKTFLTKLVERTTLVFILITFIMPFLSIGMMLEGEFLLGTFHLVLSIGFYFLLNRLLEKKEKAKEERLANEIKDERICILVLLADIIKAKNEEGGKTDINKVREVLSDYYLTKKEQDEALDKLHSIIYNKSYAIPDYETHIFCDTINIQFKYKQKKKLINLLLTVANDNGRISVSVDNAIINIVNHLKLNVYEYKTSIKYRFFEDYAKRKDPDNQFEEDYDYKSHSNQNNSEKSTKSSNDNNQYRENENLSPDEIKAYKILGVNWNDSDDTIKKAYQKLVKLYSAKKKSYKSYNQNQYGPAKEESDNVSALAEVNWAWNVIKKTRKNFQSTQNNYTNNSKADNSEESDYKFCLLVLYAQVMKADEKLMVCELDTVKNTIRRYYKTEEKQKEALQKFKEILNNEYDLDEICQTINKCLNYVAKSDLIMELLAVVYADDNFSVYEEVIIKKIAQKLNFKEEKYKSIYSIFKKKYEEGQYKAKNNEQESKKNNDSKKKSKSDESQNSNNSYNSNNKKSQPKSRTSVSEAYDILGVSGDISDAEIKKAYRALAIKYHPDNSANLGDEAIRQATETMKQINVAWNVVKMARGMK